MRVNKRDSVLFYMITAVLLLEILIMVIMAVKVADVKHFQKYISLGDKYFQEMDYENAELCYLEAIKINEKKVIPYMNLSEVYMKVGKYDEAHNIIKSARIQADNMFSTILIAQSEKIDKEKNKFLQGQAVKVNKGNNLHPTPTPTPTPTESLHPTMTLTPIPTAIPTTTPEKRTFTMEDVEYLVSKHYARVTGEDCFILSEVDARSYGYYGTLRSTGGSSANVLVTGLEIHTDTGEVIDQDGWGSNWSLYDEL